MSGLDDLIDKGFIDDTPGDDFGSEPDDDLLDLLDLLGDDALDGDEDSSETAGPPYTDDFEDDVPDAKPSPQEKPKKWVNRMPRKGSRRQHPQDQPLAGGRRHYDPEG